MKRQLLCTLLLGGCASTGRNDSTSDPAKYGDLGSFADYDSASTSAQGPMPQSGCGGMNGCYTVYAHSDTVLYSIDLSTKTLVKVGDFNAPKGDVITDLAVAPDGTLYVISHTTLYTASATDGHVTSVGPITSCGMEGVAFTSTPDGSLYAGDYKGTFCKIDPSTSPPKVTTVGTLGGGLALSGDLVAVADGTMYGTAYKLSDASKTGTQLNNLLVKIDPSTGTATQQLGSTGYPELFGVSYALGQVFGFTHDGTGDVLTIDPMTGHGTLFNTFTDPSSGKGISFAGAGVNSMVSATIQ
jgi:hypothetical protein